MRLPKIFVSYYANWLLFKQQLRSLFGCAPVKRFIRRSAGLGCLLSISVYASVRLLFHDVPFEPLHETGMLIQLLLVGCILAGVSIGAFNLLMFVADYHAQPVKTRTISASLAAIFRKPVQRSPHNGYRLFNEETFLAIDRRGHLRYRVKVYQRQPHKNPGHPGVQRDQLKDQDGGTICALASEVIIN